MKAESALTLQRTAMWKDARISLRRTPSPCLPLHSRLSSPAWDLPCECVCAGSGRADLVPARCLPAWALSTAQVFAIGKSTEQAGWLTQLSSHALLAPDHHALACLPMGSSSVTRVCMAIPLPMWMSWAVGNSFVVRGLAWG